MRIDRNFSRQSALHDDREGFERFIGVQGRKAGGLLDWSMETGVDRWQSAFDGSMGTLADGHRAAAIAQRGVAVSIVAETVSLPGDSAAAIFSPPADIVYTFDTDAQGWTGSGIGTVTYEPTGGNPGGHMKGLDTAVGQGYFLAPLTGDYEAYFGGTISFDYWQSHDDPNSNPDDVILKGADGTITLVVDLPDFPANSWTNLSFEIDLGVFKINSQNGRVATEEEIRAVLADLESFEIANDLTGGSAENFTLFDNFILSAGEDEEPVNPGHVVSSTFDTDREGWSFIADVSEFRWVATDGNPGGYLEAVDAVTGQIWYFVAPEKFLGDKSAFYGGSLTFDLRQSALNAQIQTDDLRLHGAGLILTFNTASNPGLDWTPYDVPLEAGFGWEVQSTGLAATEQQLRDVLGDLDGLFIRGEFRSGADTGGLDNVIMSATGEEIRGTAADDLLIGGDGFDTLVGAKGNDTLQGNAGGDVLKGGAGSDWADYSSAPNGLTANLKNPDLNDGHAAGDSYNSIENLRGSSVGDRLNGNNADNIIEGGGGRDVIAGRRGNDTLIGGAGKDKLRGGADEDQFVLSSTKRGDADAIKDFTDDDIVALDGSVYGLPAGALAASRFAVGTQAGDANDRFVYDDGTGQLYFDPDGSGSAAQTLIATFDGAPTLSAADFIVI